MKDLIRRVLYKIFRFKIFSRNPEPKHYHKIILTQEAGNQLIKDALLTPNPLMVVRLGSVEIDCLSFYLRYRNNVRFRKKPYKNIREGIWRNAGFFPTDDASLDAFSELYIKCIRHIDFIGVWFNFYENVVCRRFCPDASLIPLRSIEPYYSSHPWSKSLENKKVLVVHPFQESIESQYKKRRLLFANQDVLPDFDLITVRAVQSIAKSTAGFATWFEAYEHMCAEIKKIDFDVAIIGAGAYGLPLAYYAKSLGKQAIHMGGATQILFGIKGKRWDQHEDISQLYNDQWVRPLPSETPEHFNQIEEGCYW